MNHQARFIHFVLVLVVFCDLIVAQNIGQNLATKYCTKIEFTQLSFVSEFRGCFNPKYDNFIIKDYNLNFKPLHPMAKQYLSNNRVNSCAALHRNLTFDQFTYIEAGIFLKSVRAEFIEIAVEDVDKKTSYPLQYYGVGRWEIFNKNIQKNITNAQIKIIANNITPESILAIEYIYILNSAIRSPECQNTKPGPSILWWVIISVSLGLLLVIILAVGIYCILNNRKRHPNNSTDK